MPIDQVHTASAVRPERRRLPDERRAITHHFSVGGQEGYVTVGLYPDGQPGELFIKMAKEGSTVSGLMDAFATAVSLALQYGVDLEVLCDKFSHMRFEPSGWFGNARIGFAKSVIIGAASPLAGSLAANLLLWMIRIWLKDLLTVAAVAIAHQATPEENRRSSFSEARGDRPGVDYNGGLPS